MKRSISSFLLLYFIFPFTNFAQQSPSWKWAISGGGNKQEYVYDVAVDQNDNVYTGGFFQSSPMTIGTTTLTNSSTAGDSTDAFLAKFDSLGSLQWLRKGQGDGNDEVNAVVTDDAGNIYAAGSFTSPWIKFGGYTLYQQNPAFYYDIFLVKYDPSGNVIWAKSWSATGPDNTAKAVGLAADNNNNIILTGWFQGYGLTIGSFTLPSQGTFTAKLDSAGNALWAKTPGPGYFNSYPTSVDADQSGNIAVSGLFYSSMIVFGGDTIYNYNSDGNADMYIVKYDPNGNTLWARSAGGARNDDAKSAAFDPAGNLYVAGAFTSISIVLGDDTLFNMAPTFAQEDLFVVKYDVAGNYLWSMHGAGNGYDIPTSITTDQAGSVYIAGTSSQQTDLEDTIINGSYIVRTDSEGIVEWVKELGQAGVTTRLEVNGDSNIVAAGHYWNSQIVFDGVAFNNYGASDIFTGVLYKDIITNVKASTENAEINIYPNPGNGQVQIAGKFSADCILEVLNSTGQKIMEKRIQEGLAIHLLDLSTEPAGIYLIKFTDSESKLLKKLIIK